MPRQENESTMDYLGRTLDDVGLHDMARRARLGHFDDYLCPPEIATGMEMIKLVRELRRASILASRFNNADQAVEIVRITEQVMNGEFDGTKEESDAWAASPDGQETFRKLFEGE